jgi:dTDP-4-amino-4,6-dideoxygalactose transaminase
MITAEGGVIVTNDDNVAKLGRYSTSADDKLRYDLIYIENAGGTS